MKKFPVVCALLLSLMVSPCFGIQYCKDFLETGNPGGWSASLKTFDDEWTLGFGEAVELEIWINDVHEELLSGGGWITYDPSLVRIEEVLAYDNNDLPGPWSPLQTSKVEDPEGPGTYWLILGKLAGASHDVDGDILLGKVRFRRVGEGEAIITISIDEEPNFDLFVGFPSGTLYDDEISPNTITLHQGNRTIPTLSEWGMIIFMTVILGISVVMLSRKKMV
jgi:hypothetical protein